MHRAKHLSCPANNSKVQNSSIQTEHKTSPSMAAGASLLASPSAAQAHSHTEEVLVVGLNSDKLPESPLGVEIQGRTIHKHKQLKTSLVYWQLARWSTAPPLA